MATLSEMNTLVEELKSATEAKKKAEEYTKVCSETVQELKTKLLKILEENTLDKYVVPGIGQVYTVTEESFQTPKTIEEKKQLFDYIKNKYGGEDLMAKVSIHSATLNAWAKEEMSAMSSDPVFRIPGLNEPATFKKLTFRQSK